MSLGFAFRHAPRSEQVSLTSIAGWTPQLLQNVGIFSSASGERVSAVKALTLSTVWACQTIIAEDTAKVPLKVMRKVGRGSEEVRDHPAYDLLQVQANDDTTAVNAREDLVMDHLGYGHGYWRIVRDNVGDPRGLVSEHPSIVRQERDAAGTFYEIRRADGGVDIVRAEDMVDVRGPRGLSAIQMGVMSMGRALAEDRYAATYLGNASAPSGVIGVPNSLTPKQREALSADIKKKFGGARNVGEILVIEAGGSFTPISIKPQDAQLLEARQYSVEDICRWFRVQPQKVMDRKRAQGWASTELVGIEHVSDALMPRFVRIEQELNRKLLTAQERADGLFIKHKAQALMRGDAKTRATYYRMLQMVGALSPNDIRDLEDMNGIGDAGEVYLLPLNLAPVEDVASGEARKKNAAPSGSADRGGAGGAANEDPDADARLIPAFEDASRRFLSRYADRARKGTPDGTATAAAFVRAFTPLAAALGHPDPAEATEVAGVAFVAARLDADAVGGEYPARLARAVMVAVKVHASFTEGKPDAIPQ